VCCASPDRCVYSHADSLSLLSLKSFVSLGLTWWEGVICTFVGGFFISCLVRFFDLSAPPVPELIVFHQCRSRRTVSSVRFTPRTRYRRSFSSENFACAFAYTLLRYNRCSPTCALRYLSSCCIVSRIVYLVDSEFELNLSLSSFLAADTGSLVSPSFPVPSSLCSG